jgi:hypothetical protein
MDKKTKAVVTFAGARDHYQLPLALIEDDLLEAFVTDMYWPADKLWFSKTVANWLPSHLVRSRFCQGLASERVKISGKAWVISAFKYLLPQLRLNRYGDKSLGDMAKSLALRNDAAMFCCSYYAYDAFREDQKRPKHRFLFQLHPHPKSVRALLTDEIVRTPLAEFSLRAEPDLSLPDREFNELSAEPHLANGWVVASSYTARTLVENGIPADSIHIVPYGIDSNIFVSRSRPPSSDKPFTIIYVGSFIQRKGLSYLLDAVRMIKSRSVRLILCGRGLVDKEMLSHYADLDIEVNLAVSIQQLVDYLHIGDVFALPSLVEGFAHVILEAMSCGLPIIATPHTCAPDVMVDGLHGFIVPIRDSEAIAEKLAWGFDHRADLASMGEAASMQAKLFNWGRFREGIRKAYLEMITSTRYASS